MVACGSPPEAPLDAHAPAGRIAYFGFDGASLASTPDGNGGTCTTCPVAITGVRGEALSFDGTQAVELPSHLLGNAPFTISIWIRPAVDASSWLAVIAKPLSLAGANDVVMLLLGNDRRLDFESSANGTITGLGPAIGENLADGPWHQIAATWDGAEKRTYVDGAIYGRAPSVLDDSTLPVYLGIDKDVDSAVFWYRGGIDELEIYDRALEPSEIATLAGP